MNKHHKGICASTLVVLVFLMFSVAPMRLSTRASSEILPTAQTAAPMKSQQDMAPIGQVGGMIYASEVQGIYAYIGIGTRLVIWDITNPAQPVKIGQSGILSGVVRDIELAGTYAYVAVGNSGVHIIDISSPAAPTEVGTFATYGDAVGVAVSGNYAYVASIFDDFRIFDISAATAPTEVGHYGNITIAEGVYVTGNYAYVAAGGGGLQILDVSNPANPTWQGTYASTYARDVLVSGNYAYLADAYGYPNFVVVNVSNPASPVMAGSVAAPGEGYDLALNGSIIYLATWDNGVRFIDVSNPAAPNEIGYYNTSGRAEGVAMADGYAYIADTWDGFKIVNVSDPVAPALVYEYHCAGEAWDVVVDGNTAYLGDRNNDFYTLDISDPSAPVIDNRYERSWSHVSEVSLAVSGEYLFVSDGVQLHVFDVSNPASPSQVGTYTGLDEPNGISIAGDYAYIADGEGGLRVLDIHNPAAISEAGRLDTNGHVCDVVVSGNYAYLADGVEGLRIINVTNPAAPAESGFFKPSGAVLGVAVAGHHAYLSAGWNGLRVINVSNPGTPTEVGFYDKIISSNIAAMEGYVYVQTTQFETTLKMLDVSNPISPTVTAEYTLPEDAERMVISDGALYIAAGGGGLMSFQVPQTVSLDEVRPHQGRSDWVNEVNIYGENLNVGAAFRLIQTTPLSTSIPLSATQFSSTHFQAIIPAGLNAGSYNLRVENPDGGQATLANAYQVVDPSADVLYGYSDELWTGPTTSRTYEETQMGLVVHRAGGSADLTNIDVDFYDGDPDAGGTLLGTGTIITLPPNAYTSTTSIAWTPAAEGFHEIYARVNVTVTAPVTIHRSVWVLPPAPDMIPPTVNSVNVSGGATDVSTQNVTLSISASDNDGGTGVGWIFITEFDWNSNIGEWVTVGESGWLDYTSTPMSHDWTLTWHPGVKNLVAWAADRAGNISPVGKVIWLNFIPPAISINQGQVQMYGYWRSAGQTLSAQVTPVLGDPDLYIGNSSGWLGSSYNEGTAIENVSIIVPTTDLYTVAVYGYTTARYGLSAGTTAMQAITSLLAKEPIEPPVLPNSQGAPQQRALPPAPIGYKVYLPLVVR